jgi:hypothetical protein
MPLALQSDRMTGVRTLSRKMGKMALFKADKYLNRIKNTYTLIQRSRIEYLILQTQPI